MKAEEIGHHYTLLLGEIFESIGTKNELSIPELYQCIVDLLVEKSFSSEVSYLRDKIIDILPEIDRQLLSSSIYGRQLKIVLDVCKLHKVNREQESRLIYEAAMIVLLYMHILRNTNMSQPPAITFYTSYSELLTVFEEQKDLHPQAATCEVSENEQRRLLTFANIMKVALLLMSKPKKAHLLDLVTRISEGRNAKYITGSGQTAQTARRVMIFQYESGIFTILIFYGCFNLICFYFRN